MTEAQLVASSKKDLSKFLLREKSKDFPSIIKANAEELSLSALKLSFTDLICEIPSLICFLMLAKEA